MASDRRDIGGSSNGGGDDSGDGDVETARAWAAIGHDDDRRHHVVSGEESDSDHGRDSDHGDDDNDAGDDDIGDDVDVDSGWFETWRAPRGARAIVRTWPSSRR